MQKAQNAAQPPPNYEKISQDPLKFVTTFIEKKIRNLDKRKAKLDGYRKMVEDGKPLDPDQTAAAAKYDEVIGSLEFAKDLIKSFEATSNEVTKQQRKASRKEQLVREEAESSRICYVVRAMRILELLHDNELYRDDFLNGTSGACSVSQSDMDLLVKFYEQYVMKSYEAGSNVLEDANQSGSYMYELAEARAKDVVGTTYKNLNGILEKISNCGYFEELCDPDQPADLATGQGRLQSVGSESVSDEAGDVDREDQEVALENGLLEDDPTEREAASPPSEASSSALSDDEPLKTEEFVPSGNAASWQQTTQQHETPLTEQPEAGDFLKNPDNYQYSSDNTVMMRRAYEAQRLQEVLAEVQGPCQFFQESIIDHETNPSTIQYPGVDILQDQPHPTSLSTRNRPIAPSHIGASALESAFQNTQNISTTEPTIITPQGLPSVQQHVTKDSEHLPVEQTQDAPLSESIDQENAFHNVTGASTFIPTSTQPNVDYTMGHPSRQKSDNLGLGQTTFGGPQKITDTHLSYVQTSTEQAVYQQDETPSNTAHSITQQSGMQNMMQSHPMQGSDSSIPHIPLPNELQSGYQRYQTEDAPMDSKNISTQDPSLRNQQNMPGQAQGDLNRTAVTEQGGESPMQRDGNSQSEQSTTYGSRNSSQSQSGPQHHRGRGGAYNSGYRSGGGNQGGGNYQRYNNFRGGRYNGNYDSIGRPNFNNFQGNNQSGGTGYRNHQDHYSGGYRRGGGMRNNRGQGRGNPRGGGNYNRSRTYNRPHPQNEQTA